MANPKSFRILGKVLCVASVIAFLIGPGVTMVAMNDAFQQIDGTGDAADEVIEKSVGLAVWIAAISLPSGLLLLGAGIGCYVTAAILKRGSVTQNGESPPA